MAKLSSINKNERRKKLVKQYAEKFAKLKAIADDESLDETERLMARLKMAELPRNANPTRVRNRCSTTGRPRGYYRKFGLNRIELRDLGNKGLIPGLTKSSW
ncbi:MAG TPA: 30S ribosomal protein S14 [Erythrobacter sp.]|jgi:small subunit ribosomal protein S14|uniref:Small ribosomal subunit protein uS14 n=3 Tax=Qipengyuania TaxID=1855416 RepID=A0A222ETS1_9SPHN|nr:MULTISPECIES: 30S ribosomal protein S14 [Erythrobacteraceae]KZX51403.1 30S ribosomal protein S14 [Erythrobacter sp. HI00D59]KZX86689.1 30S ribosomal protein S14 [Erythrobacter sp. HI0020]KZY13701.1 30S ribosomal protein S14 [Erythrobacter sp. HI0038]KZY17049.1 30S ribosomal protein S14 [Erythrobacter sp. HI0037]MAG06567.1 30S ribosomal protein S14 [Sphingomonadaceae bacterium]MAQ28391.1 30S ribosomal protein S14 [Erythrobacter sp.]MBU1755463.1 30S ribosomal protein S14 [Alphaproteobacteri|tara:strand:- start:217386 stop:217691 length:306 start_codon:yes stop_codon:yes gene_type:complete